MTDDTHDQHTNHLPPPMTLSEFSRKGGRAGTGASKRRSPEQMRAAQSKGGHARWAKLTKEQRSAAGKHASRLRWDKVRRKLGLPVSPPPK